ncbi:MAG: hypothetical protein AAGM22_08145 [Acidobacteriota bacterium]
MSPLSKFGRRRARLVLLACATLMFSLTGLQAEVVDEDTADFGFLEEIPEGRGFYSVGPLTPPVGQSSAHFTIDDVGREIVGTVRFNGTRFDAITSLSYATFRAFPETGSLALSLQMNVDYDLTDADVAWQGRLVYEPTNAGLTVLGKTWQTWDTLAGNWWASGAPGNTQCPQNAPCTWSEVLAAFPDAGIHVDLGALLIKAGGPWTGGFWGATDDLRIGIDGVVTDFDFETNSLLFADGFESGDTTGWTNTIQQ